MLEGVESAEDLGKVLDKYALDHGGVVIAINNEELYNNLIGNFCPGEGIKLRVLSYLTELGLENGDDLVYVGWKAEEILNRIESSYILKKQ